ncbi:GlsB/YeaQ/YmgE family stress response membrane protein [Pyxidicoccus fallax]|uniref:GlsB/YeaQ/YmgE family stress response membrane protein n=1 Tax=Pyxidicoccus fallax TaxID=394095 RepID=UPI0031B569C7
MKPSRLLCSFLVALTLAGTARGQEVPEEEPVRTPPSELTPPPLVPATPPDAPDKPSGDGDSREPSDQGAPSTSVDERARPSRAAARAADPVPRVAMEMVGGITGGIAAGTLGLLAGYLISAPTVGCDECAIVSLVGGSAGVLVGIPVGTWAGGHVMGGRGTFLSAVGGSAVGWGGALLGSLVIGASSEDDTLALVLLLLPIAGATAGYELSHADTPRAPPPRAASQVQVLPVAGMTERGPRLGLMGRF